MRAKFLVLLTFFVASALASCDKKDPTLVVHYIFDGAADGVVTDASGGGHDATLTRGASVRKFGRFDVMDLGDGDGYLDMGAGMGQVIRQLEDYSIATFLRVDTAARVRGYGNFVWVFSTLASCGATSGEYVAYRVNQQRQEQSNGGYRGELVGIMADRPAPKGVWHHIAYSQAGESGTLYIDGVAVATGDAPLQPRDMSQAPSYNWLGRPHFDGDLYLKALYHDFRIYSRALLPEEIATLALKTEALNLAAE
jgi:hypothetical protein